jgi:hypothetical protein
MLPEMLRNIGSREEWISNLNDHWDFSAVYEFQETRIGIASSGDTYDVLNERLEELLRNNCQVIICACRTYDRIHPGTNAAILEIANYQTQFLEKNYTLETAFVDEGHANNFDSLRMMARLIDTLASL